MHHSEYLHYPRKLKNDRRFRAFLIAVPNVIEYYGHEIEYYATRKLEYQIH
jgi:hypothetical protein